MRLKTWQLLTGSIAALFATITACQKGREHVFPSNDNVRIKHYSFLALGDSYTVGEALNENERFPAQLRTMLTVGETYVDEITYVAATGWTTTDLRDAIEKQDPKGPFDIITLLIGVNDQNKYRDTAGYTERFSDLVQKALQLAGGRSDHVFVLSIPDYSVTPYGAIDDTAFIREQIDLFNKINRRVSNEYAIDYTDITPASREARYDRSLIAGDSLHPSGKMYKKWADLLVSPVKGILK